MYVKSSVEELREAVALAGGEIEPGRLSAQLLDALSSASELARVTCEQCGVVLIAHRTRRFCSDCARYRTRFEPARRAKGRRR